MSTSVGNHGLFRWEDSPGLKHHCAVCARPLSHPGAISSCFGSHSEPCYRFHQHLFMRYQGHSCKVCSIADNAHHQRHVDLAERVRAIYEYCGEGWQIIPGDEPERGRARTKDVEPIEDEDEVEDEIDLFVSEDIPRPRKRERKELKRLDRAASRKKYITQEEIKYLELVLHASDTNSDAESPRNPQEIEEIEKNLRYNAQIYNSGSYRRVLKEFARIPDAMVDFGGEMDRILATLRVTELIKRNTGNLGLQGRYLKFFQGLIAGFKERVVEDLLLLKKDEMEFRMRRAAFLRYTNRTTLGNLEERYAVKDWKTGEKLSTLPGPAVPNNPELIEEEEEVPDEDRQDEDEYALPAPVLHDGADLRHLLRSHKKVRSNGQLEEVVILRRSPPRNSAKPQGIVKNQPRQIRLVTHRNENIWTEEALSDSSRESHVLSFRSPDRRGRHSRSASPIANAPAVLASTETSPQPGEAVQTSHMATAHKNQKKKKKGRRAGRRARRTAETEKSALLASEVDTEEQSPIHTLSGEASTYSQLTSELEGDELASPQEAIQSVAVAAEHYHEKVRNDGRTASNKPIYDMSTRLSKLIKGEFAETRYAVASATSTTLYPHPIPSSTQAPVQNLVLPSISEQLQISKIGRHDDWIKFASFLRVDALSVPPYNAKDVCAHDEECPFESQGILDCPFHKPHCDCADPSRDPCMIVFPASEPMVSELNNRIRAEKELAYYETQTRTKGKCMIVDDDMIEWLHKEGRFFKFGLSLPSNLPARLVPEYETYLKGRTDPGPLLRQVMMYRWLVEWNDQSSDPINKEELLRMQREFNGDSCRNHRICFCQTTMSPDGANEDIVQCGYPTCSGKYYHRSCVKRLGVDKVSRWFCPNCARTMSVLAQRALVDVDHLRAGMPLPDRRASDKTATKDMESMRGSTSESSPMGPLLEREDTVAKATDIRGGREAAVGMDSLRLDDVD